MAKKSTATRQANAARRSQATPRPSDVMLVRAPKPPAENAAPSATSAAPAPVKAAPVAPKKPAAAPHAAPPVNRPRALEVTRPTNKPAPPKPAPAPAQQQAAAKVQAARIARAKATQRARTGNVITPEHYSYVINDLKWIGGLAVFMFGTIIVLSLVLPH